MRLWKWSGKQHSFLRAFGGSEKKKKSSVGVIWYFCSRGFIGTKSDVDSTKINKFSAADSCWPDFQVDSGKAFNCSFMERENVDELASRGGRRLGKIIRFESIPNCLFIKFSNFPARHLPAKQKLHYVCICVEKASWEIHFNGKVSRAHTR